MWKNLFFEQKERQEDGRKVAAYSTVLNLFLTLVKGGLAIFSGSAAVLAETIHSLTDVIGSLAVWTGIIISRKNRQLFHGDSIRSKILQLSSQPFSYCLWRTR